MENNENVIPLNNEAMQKEMHETEQMALIESHKELSEKIENEQDMAVKTLLQGQLAEIESKMDKVDQDLMAA